MSDLLTSALKNSLGLQLLQWAVSQSDVWHLAHRCSELAQKINKPLAKHAYVLDNLLTMDDGDIDCISIRDLRMNQMHFDDEDDYSVEDDNEFYNSDVGDRTQQRTNTSFANRNYPRLVNIPGKL